MNGPQDRANGESSLRIEAGTAVLPAELHVPNGARGIVLFAHGSGSSRHSPRNRAVASSLQAAGLATLLIDLLTESEEHEDTPTARLRFDIGFLAERLACAVDWLAQDVRTRDLAVGCFGASTGAGAALVTAVTRPQRVAAVVSRGGRPDLADAALRRVCAPTLLIVGENDPVVLELNEEALSQLGSREKEMRIVPGATHLFEEPGALEQVSRLAANWFTQHLRSRTDAGAQIGRPSAESPRRP